jgi:hypothetical protein
MAVAASGTPAGPKVLLKLIVAALAAEDNRSSDPVIRVSVIFRTVVSFPST